MTPPRRPTVLVVDDSATVRQVLRDVLTQRANVDVTVAADPIFALQKMRAARPDVIILDLQMPRMDGLTFLRRLMAIDPIPVVVCSASTKSGDLNAIAALEAGAVDVIGKPRFDVKDYLQESAQRLVDAVETALSAHPRRPSQHAGRKPRASPGLPLERKKATGRVVAIGASTGGTEALTCILREMPADGPPLLLVQHMPARFTKLFASRLDEICALNVVQAEDGALLHPGFAYLAEGGKHLTIERTSQGLAVVKGDGPTVSGHRPSVDVLFESVAKCVGNAALAVLLTGMGADGARGLKLLRDCGASTIAQDEASSVVFGMPGAAIKLGAAEQVLPLEAIASAIVESSRVQRGMPQK